MMIESEKIREATDALLAWMENTMKERSRLEAEHREAIVVWARVTAGLFGLFTFFAGAIVGIIIVRMF